MELEPQAALEAATQVCWSQGYAASSLPDLLAATGLSRSSLYQRFGVEQALFERCLEHDRRAMETRMRDALDAAPDGRHFIQALADFLVAGLSGLRTRVKAGIDESGTTTHAGAGAPGA